MEGDLAGFDFPVFLVDLVANQNNRDVVADSCQIFVPLWHVFVGDSGGNIEHKNSGVGSNIVALAQSSQLFLAGGIPEREFDGPVVGVESDGADLNSLSGDVLLFELSCDVALDESGLAYAAVSDEDDLELGNCFGSLHLIIC